VDSPSNLYLVGRDMIPTHNTKKDQAKIIWEEARRMVRRSPDLLADIKVFVSNLSSESTNSKFEPIGADEDSTDGLNPHGNIVDELHAHKTRGLVDVLITAMGARRQPLMFYTTTAGNNQTSIWWETRDLCVQVLHGTIEDDSIFAYIACLDEKDDWRDSKNLIKANPNLGVSVKMEYLLTQLSQAKASPAKQNTYRRLHCNIPTQQATRWIDLAVWDASAGEVDEEKLKGREFFGGLDLATVSDLTAWILWFPDEKDQEAGDVLARFWLPSAALADPSNRYRDQYQTWAAQGFIAITDGNATDYSVVEADVLRDCIENFKLVDMNVDRLFQAHQLAQRLATQVGERYDRVVKGYVPKVYGMAMTYSGFAAPMNEFDRRLREKKIRHGENPVLRWMIDNVVVKEDANGNYRPDKGESQGKIDGFVALIMGLDRAMRHQKQSDFVYKERGIVSF